MSGSARSRMLLPPWLSSIAGWRTTTPCIRIPGWAIAHLGSTSCPNPPRVRFNGVNSSDLIAVFENHVFLFFDRESRKFDVDQEDISLTWQRWKREVVDKQIKTARGAKRYLSNSDNPIYLDAACKVSFPLSLPTTGRM